MTPDAREQARHISEVTKAYAEGKAVQFRVNNGPWMKADFPCWKFSDREYRVKPEERKPREWEVWIRHDEIFSTAGVSDVIDWNAPSSGKERILVREVLPSENTGENTPS